MTDFTDPLAVFRAAVNVLNTASWSSAAALVDPVSLRVFVKGIYETLNPDAPRYIPTAEDYMKGDPTMPREVAEYHVANARRHSDPAEQLSQQFPGVDSMDAFHALPPEEILARWMDGRSAQRQIRRLAELGRIPQQAAEAAANRGQRFYPYVAIGVLEDGPQIAHVLYRHEFDPAEQWTGDAAKWLVGRPEDEQVLARELWERGHPTVAALRRQADGTWRLILDHDFLHMGGMFFGASSEGSQSAS